MSGTLLIASCSTVATHRNVRTAPIGTALDGLAPIAQPRWQAWLKKHQIESDIPADMSEILDALAVFADPLLDKSADQRTWHHLRRTWTDTEKPKSSVRDPGIFS
jgi:hypothetical protein